jgi:hypothetical protein
MVGGAKDRKEKRMRKRLAAILAVGAFGVAMALPAGAGSAPITCKGNGLDVEKVSPGKWSCENGGGNLVGANAETKNPND